MALGELILVPVQQIIIIGYTNSFFLFTRDSKKLVQDVVGKNGKMLIMN